MLRLTLAAALPFLLALPAAAAPAPAADVLPFPAVERTLPNGLKVIVVPTGFPDIVSVQISMQTGSRNEVEPGKSGFAHFFEHMMFRGTKTYPPERYQAVLTRVGARSNAYTSDDITNYHTTFTKEDLEEVLAMEADRFQHLDYDEAAFKTESRAILGEYNKNAANPVQKLFETQQDSAFKVHTYKHTTMGFLKDIEDMPNQYAYSKTFYDRWYRPEYATVVVAGDVDPARTVALVEKHFGGWKRGSYRVPVPQEPPPTAPVYAHVAWPTPTLPWVVVAFHAPAFSETAKDHAAVDLLMDVQFGETSDLYRRLVVEEQLVDNLGADSGGNVDPNLAFVMARVKRPEDVAKVRDAILAAYAQARAAPVPAARLADQKANNRNALLSRLDSTEAIAGMVARMAMHRRAYGTLNAFYRTQGALAPADLQAAARRYFTDERLVVTTLSKDPLPAGLERSPPLATLEPKPATGPAGATWPVVKRLSRLPVVTLKLAFDAGSARDPKGKEGLAALSAAMIADAGSRRMRVDEIREALHPLAASFNAGVDRELAVFTGRFPADGWTRFADVALPMLVDPGFREEDFRRVKDAQRNRLVQDLRANDDEELGKLRLAGNLFAGTPYASPVAGTVAGIDAVTLDDVKAFVKAHYVRANLTVGLAGGVPAALEARLAAELAKLPEGSRPAATVVKARPLAGMEVDLVQKDTRATAISMGHPIDVVRGHPDFVALWLARTWLGEHRSSSSHLYQRIREERGMNYGDYAYVEAFPNGGRRMFPPANVPRRAQLFEIWIRPVVPKNAPMAIKIALFELRKLVKDGLTEEQFQATRSYLQKNVALMTARQDDQLGYALDSAWYGIPDFTAYMKDGLAKLSRDQVNAAIRKHLSPDRLVIVAVTPDAKGLAAALGSGGVATVSYDAQKPAALLEEDKVIGALDLGIAPAAVKITPVDEVFAR
ncbi:MAG: pitrilysin family protein [Anaeromyxobacter sp.]